MVLFCLGYTPIGDIFQPCMKGIPGDMLGLQEGILCLFFLPFAVLSVDFVDTLVCRRIWPTALDIVRKTPNYGEPVGDAKAAETAANAKDEKADAAVVDVTPSK